MTKHDKTRWRERRATNTRTRAAEQIANLMEFTRRTPGYLSSSIPWIDAFSARMAALDFVVIWMTLFLAQSEWSHVVVWIVSCLALPPVLLAADIVASAVLVDQPSVGV